MYVELSTGKDSFRAQGNSPKRNVQVNTWVRVKDNGEGKKIIPVFEAFKKKLRGYQNTNLIHTIPATEMHGPEVAGVWYVNRHEFMPNTELLIEYRHRDTGRGSFGEEVEYFMVRVTEEAPLLRVRIELPVHHLSAVPILFFQGRFEVIEADTQLDQSALTVWRDYFNLTEDDDLHVSDNLDVNMEQRYFQTEELEAGRRSSSKMKKVIDTKGNSRIKIRRGRRIRT